MGNSDLFLGPETCKDPRSPGVATPQTTTLTTVREAEQTKGATTSVLDYGAAVPSSREGRASPAVLSHSVDVPVGSTVQPSLDKRAKSGYSFLVSHLSSPSPSSTPPPPGLPPFVSFNPQGLPSALSPELLGAHAAICLQGGEAPMIPDWIPVYGAEDGQERSPSSPGATLACLSPPEGGGQPAKEEPPSLPAAASSSSLSLVVGAAEVCDASAGPGALVSGPGESPARSGKGDTRPHTAPPSARQRDLLKKAEQLRRISRAGEVPSGETTPSTGCATVSKNARRPGDCRVQTDSGLPTDPSAESEECRGEAEAAGSRELGEAGRLSSGRLDKASPSGFPSSHTGRQARALTADNDALRLELEDHLVKQIERVRRRDRSQSKGGGGAAGGVGLRALCRLMRVLVDLEQRAVDADERKDSLHALPPSSSEQCCPALAASENAASSCTSQPSSPPVSSGGPFSSSSSILSFPGGEGRGEDGGADHGGAEPGADNAEASTSSEKTGTCVSVERDRRLKRQKVDNPLLLLESPGLGSEEEEEGLRFERGNDGGGQGPRRLEEVEVDKANHISAALEVSPGGGLNGFSSRGDARREREETKKRRKRGQNTSAERHANVAQIREEANAQASLLSREQTLRLRVEMY